MALMVMMMMTTMTMQQQYQRQETWSSLKRMESYRASASGDSDVCSVASCWDTLYVPAIYSPLQASTLHSRSTNCAIPDCHV